MISTNCFTYAGDRSRPPEARLLAAARWQAVHEENCAAHGAAAVRRAELLSAIVAGRGTLIWASPRRYDTLLASNPAPGQAEPAAPRPPAMRVALEEARERRSREARRALFPT